MNLKFRNNYAAPIGVEGIHVLNTGDWRINRPLLDEETCIKCGICFLYCPVNSIRRREDGSYYICYDYCKGCGICAHECKTKAITMVPEEEKY